MKHHDGYAIFTASVVFSLLPISALAQTPTEKPASPPCMPAAAPAGNDSEQEQDTRPITGVQPTPNDASQLESRYTTLLVPDANLPQSASQSQPIYQYDRANLFSRHMVDRTRQILVLRRLLALRFTADDISVALPLLRRLNDIKAAPPVDPEQALESEYEALLAARPGDPLPPSSAIKIMDAARYYREEQARIWSEMARKLGKTKADGLYNLLGQPEQTGNSTSRGVVSNMRPGNKTRYFGGLLPSTTAPDTDPTQKPTADLVPSVGNPATDPTLEQAVGLSPRTGISETDPTLGQAQTQPEDEPKADATTLLNDNAAFNPGAQNRLPAATSRGRHRADDARYAAQSAGLPFQELPRDKAVDRTTGSNQYSLMAYSSTTIRISLSELIDLMQTKLSAMTRAYDAGPGKR